MRPEEAQALLQQIAAAFGKPIADLKQEQEILKSVLISQQQEIERLRHSLYGETPPRRKADHWREFVARDPEWSAIASIWRQRDDFRFDFMPMGARKQEPITSRLSTIEKDLNHFLTLISLSDDPAAFKFPRYVSASCYVEAKDILFDSYKAFDDALNLGLASLGFSVVVEQEPEYGSFYKKWLAKSKDALTQPELQERLQKLERALELKTLGKEQASINKSDAESVAILIGALEKSDNAIIRIGSIVILKKRTSSGEPVTLIRNLSQKELIEIESAPGIANEPELLRRIVDNCNAAPRLD